MKQKHELKTWINIILGWGWEEDIKKQFSGSADCVWREREIENNRNKC